MMVAMTTKIKFVCPICGKELMLLPCHAKTRKTCSLACSGSISRPPKGWIAHNKGKSCSEKQKKDISKTLFGRFRGEKSSAWKGGRTALQNHIRTSSSYKLWRNQVFERDNYTCQRCGKRGGNLEVHHKIMFSKILSNHNVKSLEEAEKVKELWNIENGIVYCKKCHRDVDEYRRG